ncbi:hypothetical protein [Micromonospora endolithica]|uniref:Uncharacterized protein n=1 Tax=Micromonospora endolithica TaxID=230091 RepID=A0A3A9ZDP4_9ACTN|nr:hypothetical protein [Micromonospora endolithica]RKN46398.1 hypothetical protein D7223_15955 [Micromonospora endolithica]TWJ24860.1 hypothetical protein JD76_05018 [Micromonospora endolithica]
MESHLGVLLTLTVVWLAAGVLADGLPRLDRARALRRRTGWVFALTLTALGLTAVVLAAGLSSGGGTAVDRAATGLVLAVVPAGAVAVCAVRRMKRLWTGAGAFATAPRTPAPHGLRAAAAHPLIGLPVQVTGLALLPATLTAAVPPLASGAGASGPAVTLGIVGLVAIGVRHALRHNRLAERAMPAPTSPRPAAGPLHV